MKINEIIASTLIKTVAFQNFDERWIMGLTFIVEAEMSQRLIWRDLFVQIELGVDNASLGIK